MPIKSSTTSPVQLSSSRGDSGVHVPPPQSVHLTFFVACELESSAVDFAPEVCSPVRKDVRFSDTAVLVPPVEVEVPAPAHKRVRFAHTVVVGCSSVEDSTPTPPVIDKQVHLCEPLFEPRLTLKFRVEMLVVVTLIVTVFLIMKMNGLLAPCLKNACRLHLRFFLTRPCLWANR